MTNHEERYIRDAQARAELPRYDESKPMTCRACGAKGAHRPEYCGGIDVGTADDIDRRLPCQQFHSEPAPHLHIHCNRCGFQWPMACADFKTEPNS